MPKAFKQILYIFLSSPLFIFSSCVDDAVSPPGDSGIQVVDSNIFNWRFIPVPIKNFFDHYVIDSNNIYYAGDERLYYYNGTTSTLIYGGPELVGEVDGYDANNIFFGGENRQNIFWIYPYLKKWDGNTITDIPLPLDSNYGVASMKVLSPENIWIVAGAGRLYHYINDTIITYEINLSFSPSASKFFGNENNLYYYFNRQETPIEHYIYKFNGYGWVEEFRDATNDNLNYGTRESFIENFILRKRINFYEIYNKNEWQEIVKTPTFEPYTAAGPSINTFLSSGRREIFFRTYYFDGFKWLYQSDMPCPAGHSYSFPLDIVYANNTYFGFYYALDNIAHNYILVGNLKK